MNAANRKTDQSISDFQTGIATASQDTLKMEQLILCVKTVIMDITTSLKDSDGEITPVSEVYYLPYKIFHIMNILSLHGLAMLLIF